MKITVGAHVVAQLGDYARFKEAWMEADALGADHIYTSDHFFPPSFKPEPTQEDLRDKTFEATAIQAAMAATTHRAKIGCLVHSNSFRNPNLLADIARTIDHISGGRFVLGIGSGWYQMDYDEYGYEFGTAGSRLRDLERDLPIIKARLAKLNPPPVRPIPILIGGGGEKMTLKLTAQYADIWHYFGDPETMKRKSDILNEWCVKLGRNPQEIVRSTSAGLPSTAKFKLDDYLKLGFTEFTSMSLGPDWDLASFRDLLAWRKSVS